MRDDPLRYFVPFFVTVVMVALAVMVTEAIRADDSENAARCKVMLGIAKTAQDSLGAIRKVPHCIPGQRR